MECSQDVWSFSALFGIYRETQGKIFPCSSVKVQDPLILLTISGLTISNHYSLKSIWTLSRQHSQRTWDNTIHSYLARSIFATEIRMYLTEEIFSIVNIIMKSRMLMNTDSVCWSLSYTEIWYSTGMSTHCLLLDVIKVIQSLRPFFITIFLMSLLSDYDTQ